MRKIYKRHKLLKKWMIYCYLEIVNINWNRFIKKNNNKIKPFSFKIYIKNSIVEWLTKKLNI